MPDDFDPYREWLGIRETARPLSHYQLLGLPEFEESPLAVAVAADAAVARLRNSNAGDRRGRWQQLMDEVALARLCLSDRTRKLQYDVQLRARRGITSEATTITRDEQNRPAVASDVSGSSSAAQVAPASTDFFPPSNQTTTTASSSQAAPTVANVSQVAVTQPAMPILVGQPALVPHAAPVYASPVYAGIASMPSISAPVAYPTMIAPPRPQVYVPMAVASPVMVPVTPSQAPVESFPRHQVPAEVFEPASFSTPESSNSRQPDSHETADRPAFAPMDFGLPTTSTAPQRSRASWSPDAKSMGIFAAVALIALVVFVVSRGISSNSKEVADRADVQKPGGAGNSKPPSPAAITTPVASYPKPVDKPKPTVIEPTGPAVDREKPNPTPEVVQADPEMKKQPEPEAEPDPTPRPDTQSPEQKAAFEKAIRDARAAMGARKLDRAKLELQAAKANVGTAEQDQQLARMEELYGYVEGFWKAVVESLKGLQATDTIPIDNTEIAIVEVDERSITIRAAGRNMSYTLDDMPTGLVTALAARWFDMKMPANLLFMGAFHAVDARGDLEQARRYWQDATQGGASAENLMPLLEERTAPLVAEQGPVPPKAVLAKARQALRTSMPEEFRMAKSLERKLALARELLDMAAQNENEIERYVLYDEALNLAGDAGSAADMNTAIDGLSTWYKVDAWALRVKAFDEAADAANNPVIAKGLARELMEVVDQAIAANHPAEAAKLCNATLTAARKGKDLELVKQATERKNKLAAPE